MMWLCIISGIPLLFTCIAPYHPGFSSCYSSSSVNSGKTLPLNGLPSCLPRCFKVAHSGGFVSYQVFHCCSLGWFCIVPGVQLQITRDALHLLRCFIAASWGGSAHPRYLITPHWGGFMSLCGHFVMSQLSHFCTPGCSASSQVYKCCSIGELSIVFTVPVLLIKVTYIISQLLLLLTALSLCHFMRLFYA